VTTSLIIAGGIGVVFLMVFLYGAAKKREGRNQERRKELRNEVESSEKARKIEEDHKHDSASDIIDRL